MDVSLRPIPDRDHPRIRGFARESGHEQDAGDNQREPGGRQRGRVLPQQQDSTDEGQQGTKAPGDGIDE